MISGAIDPPIHRGRQSTGRWSIQLGHNDGPSPYTGRMIDGAVSRVVAAAVGLAVAVVTGCAPQVDGGGSASMSAGTPTSAAPAGVRAVGPDEFAAAIAEPERVTINVHVPYEGDITGTDLSIPFDQITEQVSRLPSDRDTPLAVYCRSGRMSEIAADTLTNLGYANILDLQGGMQAWRDSGRPVTWR